MTELLHGNSSWQRSKKANGWGSGFAEWVEGDTAYLSVVFSWHLPLAYQRAVWWKRAGYHVRAGGPAVAYNPDYLNDVAQVGGEVNALLYHNPNATFTSRGCIRKCPFCIVPKIEGDLVELEDWTPRPIVCDNNLLACSQKHFDQVIDRLKPLKGVDLQGLDARLLTKYHAHRIAELDVRAVHLAWDTIKGEEKVMAAIGLLRGAGIPSLNIRVYVLIGYKDTPADALYRLQSLRGVGVLPFPMRYSPLDALRRNEYVASGWTDAELKRYMRYWTNLKVTEKIPFTEFRYGGRRPKSTVLQQIAIGL